MHFHLQEYLGKRVQVLIYEKGIVEGHCFYAVDSKYLEYYNDGLIYVIWKVKLI